MKNQPLRIIVKGLNWSGSGAVVCLLQEYENLIQVPGAPEKTAPTGYRKLGEFNHFRKIGKVGDLVKTGPFFNDSAMPSQLTKNISTKKLLRQGIKESIFFLKHLNYNQYRNRVKTLSVLNKINKGLIRLDYEFQNTADASQRLELAKKWINNVVDVVTDKHIDGVIFDQAIHFGAHDDIWPKVFTPFKLIIVHRDPRDQLAEQFKHGHIVSKMHGDLQYIYGWDLKAALQFRIDATKARMNSVDKLMQKMNNKDVLLIRFESLVQDYTNSVKKIEKFLGLDPSKHKHKGKYFDINWSNKNIGVHQDIHVPYLDKTMIEELMDWYNRHP